MSFNHEGMVVCDLSDETSDREERRSSRTNEDEYYGEMLEQRWQSLWSDGKRTPGVVSGRNPLDNLPDWFDLERFTKAQKLAKKYYFR